MLFLTSPCSICLAVQAWAWCGLVPCRRSSLSLLVPSTQVFFPSFLPLPSVLFISVLKLNTLLDQERRVDDKWKVIICFSSLLPRPRQLALSGGHSLPACTTCSLPSLCLLPFVWHYLVFFYFAFCHHNLISELVFFLVLLSSLLFVFCFSSFIYPPIPFPFLPHRSGCSCGTQPGRSGFVASSQVISETLLLLS